MSAPTHRQRAERAWNMANQLGPGPLYAKPDLIAREMFPRELVERLSEACAELEFQADNYDCDCGPGRHLCCGVPRLNLIAMKGRKALALYPEPEEPDRTTAAVRAVNQRTKTKKETTS